MIDNGKHSVLGVLVDAIDYDAAVARVRRAAVRGTGYSVSALAVHAVMTGVEDDEHRYRLNNLDLATPDGQPVRWALRWLGQDALPDRVYGPELMLRICAMAERDEIPVFLYGSTHEVLERLADSLMGRFPDLTIAGAQPSRFRMTSADEQADIAADIRRSGAGITFVGLGCPRQEIFVHEYKELLNMPTVAVGAAFDYHSGRLREPPRWMQRVGLQWAYRLAQDPRRLWYRYTVLNARFLARLAVQRVGRRGADENGPVSAQPVRWG